ncbi:MAG TPA: 30S ribosomal protein S17 [Candidatus Azoamicus sp. OHIO1]
MNIISRSKILQGVVVSNKMDKTVVVRVERRISHKMYTKVVSKFSKYYVHDENNVCNVGDFVSFKEIAPISKKKHWVLV